MAISPCRFQVKLDPSAFKDISNDIEFAEKIVKEENIVILPGIMFFWFPGMW